MTTPILSESDIQILLAISKHYTEEAKLAYASSLTKLLVETARAKQIRSRFQESLQSGVSTKFLLYQLNTTDTFRSITIDIEALFNFYNIIGFANFIICSIPKPVLNISNCVTLSTTLLHSILNLEIYTIRF